MKLKEQYYENSIVRLLKEYNDKFGTITEARMSRQAIREVIRDIIKTLKRKEEGLFQLPESEEEDFYSFNNYPVQFSVELTIKLDTKISRFMTNGKYSLEDDVVEVLILVNPNKLEEQLYDIIGELNNLIAHELEHGLQQYYGEFDFDNKKQKKSKKYYMSPEELGAQVQGARRVAKLKQIPFEDAVREWFENNRDIHKMKPKAEEEVIQKILDYHQEKYGELNEFHNQKKIVNLLKEYNTKYDSLITEGNFQNTMESIVNDLLSELKTEAEEDSTNFRKEVYNWIDNVEKIEIVSYRKTQSVNNPEKKSFMFKINFEVYSLKTPTKGQLSPIIDQLELKLTRLMGTGDYYLLDIDKIINTNKIVE